MHFRLSLSSWSVHQSLTSGSLKLLDLPRIAKAHGIATVELCHFHIPSHESAYYSALRHAFADIDVELYSLLLDFGDIASPDDAQRNADIAEMRRWIGIASTLGAQRVRVDAGKQPPTPEVITRSATILNELENYAVDYGIAVSTENFHETSREPEHLLAILNHRPGRIGLCVDFGNAPGSKPLKYETLEALMPLATSVHCKPEFLADGSIDLDDLSRCLALVKQHDFRGPMSLINVHRDDEWARLDHLRECVGRPA